MILDSYKDVFDAVRKALGLGPASATEKAGEQAKVNRRDINAAIAQNDMSAASAAAQKQASALQGQTISKGMARDLLGLPDADLNIELQKYGLTKSNLESIAKSGKYALGGITNGPSLAGEAGPEAVVPLPNGKSIPIDMSGLTTLLQQQCDLLAAQSSQYDRMISKMDESINIQKNMFNYS